MYKCRPGKWILWAPLLAGLPWLAAGWLNSDSLKSEIETRAATAIGGDWAKVTFNGRDATLTGTAASQEIADKAKAALLGTYGVRLADMGGVKVEPPKPPVAATIAAIAAGAVWPYAVTGTWPEVNGNTIAATLDGKTYDLGSDALKSDGKGNYTFDPKVSLKPGSYDVDIAVKDTLGQVTVLAPKPQIVIPEPKVEEPKVEPVPDPVAAPVVAAIAVLAGKPVILTGTWPQATGNALSLVLKDKSYTLGASEELIASGTGAFRFEPQAKLDPGTYDVTAVVKTADGTETKTVLPGAIVITAPEAAEVMALPAPTIGNLNQEQGKPFSLSGTWAEAPGNTLAFSLNKKVYELGGSSEVKSDGKGNFEFAPNIDLAPGSYDVTVTETPQKGAATVTVFPGAIVITAPPPPPPAPKQLRAASVDSVSIEPGKPVVLSGKWPVGEAKSLAVTVGGGTYRLGKDFQLLTDTSGKWTLKPNGEFAPGKYDVIAQVGDGEGKTLDDATVSELTVLAPPPPPPPLPKPLSAATVDGLTIEAGKPVVLTGKWPVGDAKSLAVMVGGGTYRLGKDFELLTDTSGKWTLKPRGDFGPGKYDVIAQVGDGAGKTLDDGTSNELLINAPPAPPPPEPLPPPTVNSSASDSDRPVVTGTWPVRAARTLQVQLDGITHVLGQDFDLLTDTSGKWTLKPAKPLVNGTYDVVAKVTDGAERSALDATKDELVVNVAAPPPPPPPSQPYDCEATLAKIAAVFPVRFAFDRDVAEGNYALAINQYASLLNDPRCAGMKVEVAGHADYYGSERYNLGLSERRAQHVIDVLAKAGIDVARLKADGFSEDKPLDPDRSDEARAKNRRVEFNVIK